MDVLAACPWDRFDPATIEFCEERLCAWIVEPCNAYTSLSKTPVGVWILWACWRSRVEMLGAIGLVACFMGIGGFSLHATGTFWGEVMDLTGMFLLSGLFVTFNLRRLGWSDRRLAIFYVVLVSASLAMLLSVRPSGIAVFITHLTAWVALEVHLYRRRTVDSDYDRTWLKVLVGSFAVAFGVWVVDKLHLVCDPTNHVMNGHGVWHIVTSLCVYFFFRYHWQFRTGPTAHTAAA